MFGCDLQQLLVVDLDKEKIGIIKVLYKTSEEGVHTLLADLLWGNLCDGIRVANKVRQYEEVLNKVTSKTMFS